ncbi:hypothetical protein T4B_10483 [Trichinella pseudospiralis]|uniref:Uncharacterized protein n=1 Tax=Trichinella pseudospiralis TaxID=6337 RepID=A0A0V1ILD5_TRIPS|nr:hypothetical protein T4B_10872 [Trichinella pseudospiralis]KRZ23615.1 hypothetical protein T4B_10483 [Trichinella pseudospiralis]
MSLVYQGRVYKDKKGCDGAMWTNLDVTSVIKQNDHVESCSRARSETHPGLIYDEEASVASEQPSTSGYFPLFKWVMSKMYSHRNCLTIVRTCKSLSRSGQQRLLAAMRTWAMDGTFKVVPQWCRQLFTIHDFMAHKLVPVDYCLCTGKDIGTRVRNSPDTSDSVLLYEYKGTELLFPLLQGGT